MPLCLNFCYFFPFLVSIQYFSWRWWSIYRRLKSAQWLWKSSRTRHFTLHRSSERDEWGLLHIILHINSGVNNFCCYFGNGAKLLLLIQAHFFNWMLYLHDSGSYVCISLFLANCQNGNVNACNTWRINYNLWCGHFWTYFLIHAACYFVWQIVAHQMDSNGRWEYDEQIHRHSIGRWNTD